MKRYVLWVALCLLGGGAVRANDFVLMQPLVAYSASRTALASAPALPVMSAGEEGGWQAHFGSVAFAWQAVVTAVEPPLASSPALRTVSGGLMVSVPQAEEVPCSIYDVAGRLMHASVLRDPSAVIALSAGVYLVKVGQQAVKVQIVD